jgi:hypothetical protein
VDAFFFMVRVVQVRWRFNFIQVIARGQGDVLQKHAGKISDIALECYDTIKHKLVQISV